ncbi:MAG: winged helix-turn-helix domain-containing protein [Anaerolineales bacterium]
MVDSPEGPTEIGHLPEVDTLIHAPSRLKVMTYLYVVDSIDFVFLKRVTGMSWGNLSTHLTKLEEAGYISISKSFQDKKPNTMIELTDQGRRAFRDYKDEMQQVLGNLPD